MEPQCQYPWTLENKLSLSPRTLTQEVGLIMTRPQKITLHCSALAPSEFLFFFLLWLEICVVVPFILSSLDVFTNQYCTRLLFRRSRVRSSSFCFQQRSVGSFPDQRLVLEPLFLHALYFRYKKARKTQYWRLSCDVTEIQTRKLLSLLRLYFHV